ncbi:MAG TPA: ABC transporter permease subunit [Fibrobacteria bacterium]|nr:ABC transporter permease subunit [Fibrobacteria bacterium]
MKAALRLARHEWHLILNEPRFLLPFLVSPLVLIGIQSFAVFFRGAASPSEAYVLAKTLLMMLAVLAPSMAVPLGADSFAGEKERNTLEILLCLPVGPLSLFWGKVLGILPMPVLVGWLGQGILLGVLASRVPLPPEALPELSRAFGLTPAVGLFFGAFSARVSLGAETVRGAAQLGSLGMLAVFGVVISLSGALQASAAWYAGTVAALLLGAGLCLLSARRRFLRLPA